MSYNSWSNRETWIVNVWFNPKTKKDVHWIKELLEEGYDVLPNGPLKDMIDIQAINWQELEDAMEE